MVAGDGPVAVGIVASLLQLLDGSNRWLEALGHGADSRFRHQFQIVVHTVAVDLVGRLLDSEANHLKMVGHDLRLTALDIKDTWLVGMVDLALASVVVALGLERKDTLQNIFNIGAAG